MQGKVWLIVNERAHPRSREEVGHSVPIIDNPDTLHTMVPVFVGKDKSPHFTPLAKSTLTPNQGFWTFRMSQTSVVRSRL